MDVIYLDNASTTWPKPESVYAKVEDWLRNSGGSPGRGGHRKAREANSLLLDAREELSGLFNISNPDSVIFAYSATDALNTALFGLLKPGDRVVTTAMEHNAVARPLRHLESLGVELNIIGCDAAGRLDMKAMAEAINTRPRAVIMSHGSNVAGSLAPVEEVGKLTAANGVVLIVDAAQTAGIEIIDVEAARIDIMAFSGHKSMFGLQGTAALYIKPSIDIMPLRMGGTGSRSESDRQPCFMPDQMESGTLNMPGIAGLLAGVRFIRAIGIEKIRAAELKWTKILIENLKSIPGVCVVGPKPDEPRTPVVSFTIEGMDSGWIAHLLDRDYGVASRGGLHCAPWAHAALGTLGAGTVRLSPGYFTTEREIGEALRAVEKIADEGMKK